MKKILTSVATLAAAALALTACSGGGGNAAGGSDDAAGGVKPLSIGNFLDVTSWDPSLADVGFDGSYLSAIYDPLPALTTEWEISDDFKTITMDLRSDAKFSDGAAFDTDAAVKSLEYLQEGARSQEAYRNVESFEAVDEDTIAINLTQRDDTILYYMGIGRSYMMSPDAIDAGTLAETPVGSGPYTLSDDSIPGAEYHFEKVSDHRASAIAVRGDEIIAVGTDAEIAAFVGGDTRIIELGGRAVLPGINDSHLHGSWLGARWPHTLFGDMNPETASGLPARLVSTREERRADILRTGELLAAAGITSYTEPGIGPGEDEGETGCFHSEVIEIYRELAAAGELRQRVTLLALHGVLDGPSAVDTVVAGIRSHAGIAGDSDPRWFAVPGIKVFGDLIPLTRNAWTAHGYDDGTHGDLLVEGESIEAKAAGLAAIVREAHLAGLQLGVHATGDRTIGLVLDTIEAAAAEPGAPAARDARHVIIHGDLATPDQVEQIARLGACLSTQSGIAALTADWLVGTLGEDVPDLAWQLEAALDGGVLALSSDAPVLGFDWRRGIADADARILRMRESAGAVPAEDAAARLHGLLRAYTAVPAAQDRAESWKGTLEPGKVADLVVLARDPFEVGAECLAAVDREAHARDVCGSREEHDRGGNI